ncbi:M23 family metallopeptidase [Gordonia sp. OPL2]|uniref:M23 family metallopeptidase n=1 Tax=Gordonia sp. OPL2 TaxID=2486274 RepID=UPI00292A3E2C|nr:M23 family metallopeptidase [Gordonia sp. OPL2]
MSIGTSTGRPPRPGHADDDPMDPIGPPVRLKNMTSTPDRPARLFVVRGALCAIAELLVVAILVWAVPAVAVGETSRFRLPVPRPTSVVRGFDLPAQRWEPGHRGVDLSVAPGTIVRAAGPGRVQFAGRVAGRPLVSIRHATDLITTYEPVEPTVRTGSSVRRGDAIGTVSTGHEKCRATACLHWGARRGRGREAVYLNPLALLGAVRVRLKPVQPVRPAGGPADARPAGAPH